jgi:SmpB protein
MSDLLNLRLTFDQHLISLLVPYERSHLVHRIALDGVHFETMGSYLRRVSLSLTIIAAAIDCSASFRVVSLLPSATARTTKTRAIVRALVQLHAQKKKGPKQKSQAGQTMAVNRVAYRNYEIIEKIEAGISLKGTEGLLIFRFA